MEKKAAVIVSFSWIFMIIIGSFFILFAYNIVSTYQDNEEYKNSIKFKNALGNIFTAIGEEGGSQTTSIEKIEYIFENTQLELECIDGNIPILGVNGNFDSNNEYLKNYPFVMTKITQDEIDEVYVAVEKFDMPFYVTPIMALVSERNLYVFDEIIWEKIFEEKFTKNSAFKELNYEVINIADSSARGALENEYKDKELDSITIVYNEQIDLFSSDYSLNYFPKFQEDTMQTYIKIRSNPFERTYGTEKLEFTYGNIEYRKTSYWATDLSNEYNFSYLDLKKSNTLPTMAVFATPESFECAISNVDKMINNSYQYYIDKSNMLYGEVGLNPDICRNSNDADAKNKYFNINESLNDIKDSDKFKSIADLNNNIFNLWKANEDLERNGCFYVY